jgi:capsular polysaccharide transport system permease protein
VSNPQHKKRTSQGQGGGKATAADSDVEDLTETQAERRERRAEARRLARRETQMAPAQDGAEIAEVTPAAVAYPSAVPARPRRRHWALLVSFILVVMIPTLAAAWYLYERAADQYASTIGFSVRTEEAGSAIELLGGIASLSGSSSSDTDILFEFLQSQELVAALDDQLDLRAIWARADPDIDPIFAYQAPGTIEDLVRHWGRMVRIYYDSGTGLLELRVLAFTPDEARLIAQGIFRESSAMINQLSAIAREDALGYSRDELEQAEDRLAAARVALAEWRNLNQTIDPTADTVGQMGLVTNLQAQLAEALIELDLLRETTRENDPRLAQAERLIRVIEDRIAAERAVLGTTGAGESSADLVGEYERLAVDLEFAQQSYTASLGAFYVATGEAQRQSRYLAAHIRPTLAERAEYPDRIMLLGLVSLFLLLGWTVAALVAYSLRDRR